MSSAEKYKIQLLDAGLDFLKTASEKVIHKAGEFLGNKVADAVTKLNVDKVVKPDKSPRNVEETIIPPEKRDKILKKLRKVL